MIGEGPGAGYNINIPWEHGQCSDADYVAVWDHVLIPIAKEYNPDIILVSAGFDAGFLCFCLFKIRIQTAISCSIISLCIINMHTSNSVNKDIHALVSYLASEKIKLVETKKASQSV